MNNFILAMAFLVGLIGLNSCSDDNSTDPNVLGGDTEIPITEVGSEFGVYIEMEGDNKGVLGNIRDEVKVSKRENGVTTISCKFVIDEESLKYIDTLMGTQELSEEVKRQIVDAYLDRFDANLDTTDKQNITITTEVLGKVTTEGIQDYLYSKGNTEKPFTLVKYNANVGDKYTFTDEEGNTFTREVVSKSTEDDYEIGFLRIKVIKIEETQPNDPMISKIIYYANHKFGLVGVEIEMKNGLKPKSTIIPWDIMEF